MNRATTLSRFVSLTVAAVALLGWPVPSRAYKMDDGSGLRVQCNHLTGFAHWNQRNITWYHNATQGQGAGKRDALVQALAQWSTISDASYSLSLAPGTVPQGMSLSDSQNTFVWDAASYCGSSACHAITFLDVTGSKEIIEADIVFNNSMSWRTDGTATSNCSTVAAGTPLDTQAIATHELGHSLGIHHPLTSEPSFSTATMGGQSCNVAGRSLTSDDQEALRCSEDRYPVSPVYEGFHEIATCSSISGWAWNKNRPNRPVYVEIRDGSSTMAVAAAGLFRSDLLSAGKGNGYHAFVQTPSVSSIGTRQTITTRFNNSGVNLTWSPRDIACSVALFDGRFPTQVLDTGGTTYTVGTQISSSQAGKIKELWYFKAVGETATGQLRLWNDAGGAPVAYVANPTCRLPSSQGQWCGGAITPYSIQANTLYRVGVETYTKQAKSPCGTTNSLATPILKWPLTAHQGFWTAGNTFPSTGSCSNFFVDVRFDT